MVLWECTGCGTSFAVGLLRCPRCRGFDYLEEGSIVPKSTLGGASNAAAGPGEVGHVPPADAAAHEPAPQEPHEPAPAGPADAADGRTEAAESDAAPSDDPAAGTETAQIERPAPAAHKPDWAAYQISRGLDPAEADRMRKAELVAWEPATGGDTGAEPSVATTMTITAEATVTRGQPDDGEPGE